MTVTMLFSENVVEAIALSLLHSLWQGALIFLLLKLVLAFVPVRDSSTRYIASVLSLLIICIVSITTFTLSYSTLNQSLSDTVARGNSSVENILPSTLLNAEVNMFKGWEQYIFVGWILGMLVLVLRLVGGWLYLSRVRSSATILQNQWANLLQQKAHDLGVEIQVTLGESTRVISPIVVGIMKPIILIPAGLTSGLSSAQIEAVFIHELVHIKRNDFLMNLMQSMVETVYFFNPFIWLISSIVRDERENCCDDAVIRNGMDKRTYVLALASLEELRLTENNLALSLAQNKNQLLHRIKRLMETSVRNYPVKERMIPISLLVVGLMCASWFSIQKGNTSPTNEDPQAVKADTTIKKNNKTAVYSKKKTVIVAPDAAPQEQVEEYFEGDESLKPLFDELNSNLHVDVPAPAIAHSPLPPIDDVNVWPPFPPVAWPLDTIPPKLRQSTDWHKFQQEFEAKFQERFEKFYEKNESEIQKMMQELQAEFERNQESSIRVSEDLTSRIDEMTLHVEALREQQINLELHEHELREMHQHMEGWHKEQQAHMQELEKDMKKMEENMQRFEAELTEELIKDGYLKSGDKTSEIQWDDEGKLKVNGVEIKGADIDKYKKMHRQHFGENARSFHYSE